MFHKWIKNRLIFSKEHKLDKNKHYDKADLVQTIIIIAGLAVASIVAITGLSSVVMEKGEATARCISNFSSTNNVGANFEDDCRVYTWEVTRDNANTRTYSIRFDEPEKFDFYVGRVIQDCQSIRKDIDYDIGTRRAQLTYTCTLHSDSFPGGEKPGAPMHFDYENKVTKVLW